MHDFLSYELMFRGILKLVEISMLPIRITYPGKPDARLQRSRPILVRSGLCRMGVCNFQIHLLMMPFLGTTNFHIDRCPPLDYHLNDATYLRILNEVGADIRFYFDNHSGRFERLIPRSSLPPALAWLSDFPSNRVDSGYLAALV